MAVNDIVMGAAGASGPATYIEDVFSTWLYTGTGSAQIINNGIDLSGKGGLVWGKDRGAYDYHNLIDTNRGGQYRLVSNDTSAQYDFTANGPMTFNANGFTTSNDILNGSGSRYVSWTFRKQPKFFDIVTYTGDGDNNRQIAHNLGSAPGCIIIKATSTSSNWPVWHRGNGTTDVTGFALNDSARSYLTGFPYPTSTTFPVTIVRDGSYAIPNDNGVTYVAYLFAHNAGGFGATGTDNVISCGSYTGNGSATGPVVTLGYEPQWLMIKNTTGVGNWQIIDNMRGMPVGIADATLQANLTNAESSVDYVSPTATGFQITSTSSQVNTNTATYIYIAIRRPMKTPTTGTSVFAPTAYTGDGQSGNRVSTTVGCDAILHNGLNCGAGINWYNRLIGNGRYEITYSDAAEQTDGPTYGLTNLWNSSFQFGSSAGATINNGNTYSYYTFTRAPGFFDVVCYTGSNGYQDLSHNLGVTPQMVIIKNRTNSADWIVGLRGITGTGKYLVLNSTAAIVNDINYFGGSWTNTYVQIDGNILPMNQNGSNYVMYLFATVAGVSKVGSYTGTGATLNINAGFTTGARFVMIKRTDSTGNWFVWDTARGMVAGTDPRLALNSTAAESNANWVYTASSGFQIVTNDASVNASGGSYIYLAIS